MSPSIQIESHDDESVTLRVGSITAHISGDSWKDANQAALVLGDIIAGTYEASDARRRVANLRTRLDAIGVAFQSLEDSLRPFTVSNREAASVARWERAYASALRRRDGGD